MEERGVHIVDVGRLMEERMRQRALETAPKENPFTFSHEHAQKLSDIWFIQRKTATVEQKNRMGIVYIAKVLNLGEEMATRFVQGDRHADHEIGMRHAGVTPYKPDLAGFWAEMLEVFPGVYTDDDIRFLVEEGGVMAVWYFEWHLEIPLAEDSPVLRKLANNAHAYK